MSYAEAISLLNRGRANPSDYQVIFPTLVTSLSPEPEEFNNYISYFTRAATLPGTSNSILALSGQENIGISRNVVTAKSFGSPAVFTFSDRSDLIIYNTLSAWMNLQVLNSGQDLGSNRNLRVNFYDSVKCDIIVHKLEQERTTRERRNNGNRGHLITGTWRLINCIPVGIEQTTLAVESADSLLDFTISVGFESFSYTKAENTDPSVKSVILGGR